MSSDASVGIVVKETVSAVLQPLTNGISFINSVYKALIKADVDRFTNQYSDINIRTHIVEAEKSLKASEQAANAGLRSLDASLEKLTQDEGRLEQEKKNTEQMLNSLKIKQTENETLLTHSHHALNVSREHLNATRHVLQNQRERRHNAQTLRDAGIGVSFIPIVGWIAGPIMATSGAADMDNAEKSIASAEEEVRRFERQVETYRSRVSEYGTKISDAMRDMNQKNFRLNEIGRNIENVKQKKENFAEFQSKVRNAVHLLSLLRGKVSVVEVQTRHLILQQPVIRVMEEVMNATVKLSGNELARNSRMLSLVNEMKENNQRLKALCASQNDPGQLGYY